MNTSPIVQNGRRDTTVQATMPGQRSLDGGWRFRCPTCQAELVMAGNDALICTEARHRFERVDGIWRFLTGDRLQSFDRFIQDYETVRRAEGRFSEESAYYRALPFQDLTGRFSSDWRIRATTYRALIRRLVAPMEADRRRSLRVLDLGAGNGWLSNRLAERGHSVIAVDLQTNEADGLGAHHHYETEFTPVQAEFDHLPFDSEQADIAIFNGSIHYARNFEATIREALRVLRSDGVVVILDSPIYHDPASGAAMVREREARFTERFGFPSNSVPMENYLTFDRLDEIAAALGIRWTLREPFYGVHWHLRPFVARVLRHREPARFFLICGTRERDRLPGHRRLRQRVIRRWLRFRLPAKARRQQRTVLEHVCGLPIVVMPQVFNPRLLRSGEILAAFLSQESIPIGCRVLDLGTGSGVNAVVAARWAREVVAVDINPEAARCARANALINHVDDRVTVLEGDLFESIKGERFDRILFNPPYFRGAPRDLLDYAWRSEDVIERFSEEVGQHVTNDGSAFIILSSDGPEDAFIARFRNSGHEVQPLVRHDMGNEVFTIYRLAVTARNADDPSV